jgi:hypothetical protein
MEEASWRHQGPSICLLQDASSKMPSPVVPELVSVRLSNKKLIGVSRGAGLSFTYPNAYTLHGRPGPGRLPGPGPRVPSPDSHAGPAGTGPRPGPGPM